jgi:hypothetical protein
MSGHIRVVCDDICNNFYESQGLAVCRNVSINLTDSASKERWEINVTNDMLKIWDSSLQKLTLAILMAGRKL